MNCSKCLKEAKISLPYAQVQLCSVHFIKYFEKRIKRNIRVNGLIKKGEKIAIGVSGGKDSLVCLYVLNKIYGKLNEFHAIMIDEGIEGYRDKALEVAIENCEEWNIPYTYVDQKKETGYSTTNVVEKISVEPKLGTSCGFCGTFRRFLLNKYALKVGADKLATGHNLDDEAQSICMNFFNNDIERLIKLGPIAGIKDFQAFVPRIKPLYTSPEKEVIAFAGFVGIKTYSEECCPYSWAAKRNFFREMLNDMEEKIPGTKFAIIHSLIDLKKRIPKSRDVKVGECNLCGEPAVKDGICNVCSNIEKLDAVKSGKINYSPTERKTMTCTDTKAM